VFDAMDAGAVDFIAKPNLNVVRTVENFIYELTDKIKTASVAKFPVIGQDKKQTNAFENVNVDLDRIIAIGSSTGGTEAVYTILKALSTNMPGIVITQHIPPVFSNMFAQRLNNQTQFQCKEAQSGDYVEKGKVLVAPGDKHMVIKRIGERYKVDVFEGEKVNGHCPSVDVLFESVAKEAGNKAIGIILTGMGYDGAKGLLAMRRKGARTIGQDEKSSVVYGMPKVAFDIGAVEKQVPLDTIHQYIYNLLRQ
jgi:two-component system chemotaxis response regulator CheB